MPILTPRELKDTLADNLVDTSEETHYTVPGNVRALISKATLHNSDASASIPVTISIGAIGDSTKVFEETLAPKETLDISGLIGTSLAAGVIINKQATTTANKVNIYLFGTPFPA